MNQTKMIRKSVTMPEEVAKKIEDYCEKERRSVSSLLTLLAENFLKDMEKKDEFSSLKN
jgi:metal-responsive CopG/Arc/MetJ family transcriptional regulator